MLSDKRLQAAAFAIAIVFMAGTARAQYMGVGISVSSTDAGNALLSTFNTDNTGTVGKVTFAASGLDFNSYGILGCPGIGNPPCTDPKASTDYTVSSFLNSLGFASGLSFTNGLAAGSTLDNMLFEFTGTAHFTNGQSFTLSHDDGADLWINGSEYLKDGGPTSPVTTPFTYTGATGNFGFQFVYGECCGAPAVFETTLVPASTVPEPTTFVPLGTLLLGVAVLAFRRKVSVNS